MAYGKRDLRGMCRSPKTVQKQQHKQNGRCERCLRKGLQLVGSLIIRLVQKFTCAETFHNPEFRWLSKPGKKILGFCIKLGITEKPERANSLTQATAAFLKSLFTLRSGFCSVPLPFVQERGDHTLPFTTTLGIAALSRGPSLRNYPLTAATTSCVSFRRNPKLHCPPQNNPNVQESALLLLSPVPCDKRAMPAAHGDHPSASGIPRGSSSRLSSSFLRRRVSIALFLPPCCLWQPGHGSTLEAARQPWPCQATACGPAPRLALSAGGRDTTAQPAGRLCKQAGGDGATMDASTLRSPGGAPRGGRRARKEAAAA